jgi:hypothetical protein
MTKSTSPAANAGLPAIDRRALVCGLGTAAVAGVPALPIAAPTNDDPVFQAMAALEQLRIHAERPDAAHSVAEDAILDARIGNVVTLDGEEMRTHEQIDAHFTPSSSSLGSPASASATSSSSRSKIHEKTKSAIASVAMAGGAALDNSRRHGKGITGELRIMSRVGANAFEHFRRAALRSAPSSSRCQRDMSLRVRSN